MLTASLYLRDPSLILSKSIKILYLSKEDKPKIRRMYSILYVAKRNASFKVEGHLLGCIFTSIQLFAKLATLLTLIFFSAVV